MAIVAKERSSEKFETVFDLEKYLRDPHNGWKPGKDTHGLSVFLKRFSGVWFSLLYSSSLFGVREVHVWPKKMPRGTGTEVKERVTARLPIKGLTVDGIEREISKLVKEYKELEAPRKQMDPSSLRYRGQHGKEALLTWKADVEEVLQEIIDLGAKRSRDYTTADLIDDILNNRTTVLHGVTRDFMARTIRSLLESMAKKGKIEKDTNERLPKWFGKNWV